MTMGDLIDILEEYSRDTLIVLSSDREGNNYSPLDAVSEAHYEPVTTWYGECEFNVNRPNALVLWPVN